MAGKNQSHFVNIQELIEDYQNIFRNKTPGSHDMASKSTVRRVFKIMCRDKPNGQCWRWVRPVSQKTWMTQKQVLKRKNFATLMLGFAWLTPWYCERNIIYMDPVKFVRPTQPARVETMHRRVARKGFLWASPDALWEPENLPGVRGSYGKQTHTNEESVWFMLVLTRGKLSYEELPAGFTNTQDNVVQWVENHLRYTIGIMLADHHAPGHPTKIVVDRGTAHGQNFRQALQAAGFDLLLGDQFSMQPGNSADVLPHETVAGCMSHLYIS